MKRALALLLALLLLVSCGTGSTVSVATSVLVPATPSAVAGAVPTPPLVAGATRTPAANGATPGRGATATGSATPARSAVNVTAIASTTPAAGGALVDQAIGELIDNYVDKLQSNTLYQFAYDGAVATLRASGKAPQVQTLNLTGDRTQDAATFKAAYLALTQNVGNEINQSVVAYEAIQAAIEHIDECHTYFLTPEQNKQAKAQEQGQTNYSGIGVLINSALRPPTVAKVYAGSPAEKAGLRAGDQIIAVGDTDVTDLPIDQVSPLVRGPEGSQVKITIRRPGQANPLTFTITRATVNVPNFEREVREGPNKEKIGYMALSSFSATTTRTGVGDGVEKDVQAALEYFQQQGVQYWILDLRNNPGGYVETLRRVASRFIQNGQPVAYYVRANGQQEAINTDRSAYFSNQHPFAVLINEGSASSSEAFSAAAQDYGFARLFGQKTAGCLAAAQSSDLADGSALSITVEKVVSPKKREINRVGVSPEEAIQTDPASLADPVRDAAIAWLIAQPQPQR
jgi:carboxyl-terminal processing protease